MRLSEANLLETSRPGVFAVGDVRGGNVKRVASASAKDRLPSPLSIKCFISREVGCAPRV